jgi:hypothetical protein
MGRAKETARDTNGVCYKICSGADRRTIPQSRMPTALVEEFLKRVIPWLVWYFCKYRGNFGAEKHF